METYLQLQKKSSYKRHCALQCLANAAKEINSSARLTAYFGSNSLYQKHSLYSVSREINDALDYFKSFHNIELSIKERQKYCKRFTNKRFQK